MRESADFSRDLAFSKSKEGLPLWEQCYRHAFPEFMCMQSHSDNGWWQHQGIDRSITLRNSKQYLVDEKVDRYDNDNIFIEVWSDFERRSPGWAWKSLMSDYIAMAKLRKGKCLLLPVSQLQAAFLLNKHEWKTQFGCKEVMNKRWTTVGIPVPESVIWKSIGQALRASFEPFSEEEAYSIKG